MRCLAAVGALLAAVALAACGAGGDSTETVQIPSAGAARPSGTAASRPPRRSREGPMKMSRAERVALPQFKIRARPGRPPRGLVVRDVRKGSGAVLRHGDTMLVVFAGIPYGDSLRTTPATRNRPETLRVDEVIDGWTEGLPGMRVGGRRELTVPARLGDAGTTMIYQVDLLAIKPPPVD